MLAAVKREWPGNDAPIFRGNKANMEKLDKLVQTLTSDCQYRQTPFHDMGDFGSQGH